ncbi:cupin domain-containing protein [Rhodocyclus tenuis]|uniref:Cupin 2 domain-containing protein n=1 Tax=Rhodocyclus tenuis TaxID=1066 RepID=A0A840GKF8_RHOTE|nr:cupin [Rhodocyclus tenuis]MBB4248639.1 cupin 2 domain-containing protein [Rhodocyclus tenuis]
MSTPDANSRDAPEARDADSTAPAAVQGNLFAALPTAAEIPAALAAGERFDRLLQRPGLRLERIVSTGQASPPGFWYEQADAEWVVLLTGAATLRFADEAAARSLQAGDWLYIAPGRRHRVESTDAARPSVWLALHFAESGSEGVATAAD